MHEILYEIKSIYFIVHFIPNIYCPNKARTRNTFVVIKKSKDTFFQLRFDIFANIMYLVLTFYQIDRVRSA